jgi:hypothetical protein
MKFFGVLSVEKLGTMLKHWTLTLAINIASLCQSTALFYPP